MVEIGGQVIEDHEAVPVIAVELKHLDELSRETKGKVDTLCKNCLVRKIVYGVVAVMGLTVVGGLLALVLKSGGLVK